MTALRLFLREGCHLCETMIVEIQPMLQDRKVQLEIIDVDRSADTQKAYGHRVPVLESAYGDCLSEYFLDQARLEHYLRDS